MHYADCLESDRLTTRFITPGDITIWTEYCCDPVATRFTAIPGKTPEELSRFFIDRTMQRYAEGRGGLQALISKDTGEFVGQCGLLVQDVNGIAEVEIGYHLLPRFWGRGYAAEAAQLFRDYGFGHTVAPSLISIIDPGNSASQKVAIRNGMILVEKNTLFHDVEHDIFRITRREWETFRTKEA